MPKPQFEIQEYREVPVNLVLPNPRNPRPQFHFSDADPKLKELGDSIKSDGQHRPGLAFELVGHYEHPDQPGHFMLLQGESRWRACKLAGVPVYRLLIVPTPDKESAEMQWFGIEDSYKRDWGRFFLLKWAWELSRLRGLRTTAHHDIMMTTGLSMRDLETAEKIFALHPEIQEMISTYEQEMYRQTQKRIEGGGGRLGRLRAKENVPELTVRKASIIYDIFTILRANFTQTVEAWDDLTIQHKLASHASKRTTSGDDLETLRATLRAAGRKPIPGLVMQVISLLEDPAKRVKSVNAATHASQSERLGRVARTCEKLDRELEALLGRIDQSGNDSKDLMEASRQLLKTCRLLSDTEHKISTRIRDLEDDAR